MAVTGTKVRSGSASPACDPACLSSLGPLAPLPLSKEAHFPVGGLKGLLRDCQRCTAALNFITDGSLFFSSII